PGRHRPAPTSLGQHLVELRSGLLPRPATGLVPSIVGWCLLPRGWDGVHAPPAAAGERSGAEAASRCRAVRRGLTATPPLAACVAGYWAVNQLVPVLLSFTPTEGSTSQIIPDGQYLALLIKTMLAFGIAFVVPVVMVLLNFMGLVSGRTMLKGWRWIIFLSFAFTAVMVPTPEPITLIAMSAAIASLFFGAIVIALIHDRRTARKNGDGDLSDDEASSIDDGVEEIDGPSRLDDADEDGR